MYIKSLENEKFTISEGDIRYYRETVVPAIRVDRPSMLGGGEASEQLWTLVERYLEKQIKAEQFIKEMDGKIRMMQMEDY